MSSASAYFMRMYIYYTNFLEVPRPVLPALEPSTIDVSHMPALTSLEQTMNNDEGVGDC